jgi:hypothetical protein
MEQAFDPTIDPPDFWALSDLQLARGCLRIAEGRLPEAKPLLRAEAVRLFLLWQDTLNAVCRTRGDIQETAGTLAALRKRTIQVLVRLSLRPHGQHGIPGAARQPGLVQNLTGNLTPVPHLARVTPGEHL